jgi:glycosyltransferase involved in cell wall biosynthesis
MKNTLLLSIVIPVYNEKDRISHLLELLKKQDKPQLEIIAVDDGSSDKSFNVLKSFLGDFYNYKCFRKENGGSGSARNYALSHVSGKYIYFLDADDSFCNDLIKTLFFHLNSESKNQMDLLIFGYHKKIIKDSDVVGSYSSKLENYQQNKNKNILNEFHRLMGMDARLSIWNKVFRSEIIRNNEINFPLRKRTEDMFFFLDYVKYINNILVIPDILYYHSSHHNAGKIDDDLITNHVNLYERLKGLFGANPSKVNNLYLLNMFISWFAFVIPLNISRNIQLRSNEKTELLNGLFQNNNFSDNLKSLSKLEGVPIKFKVLLFLLNLKSPCLLIGLAKFSEKVPREKIKKIMKAK